MTISNEVKVGLLALVTLLVSLWGFQFIRGKNMLKRSNLYYVEYKDVNLLKISSPVTINGVQVGFVSDIKPLQETDNVLVTIDLNKDVVIPKSTLAEIRDIGFMGGKGIVLDYERPCSGPDCAQSGDYLEGRVLGMIGSMVTPEEMTTYMDIIQQGIKGAIDTLNSKLLGKDAEGPLAESLRDLQGTLANLNSSTGKLDALLANSSGNIEGSLKNLRSISANIQANNDKIGSLISNAEKFSRQLDQVSLQKTVGELDQTMAELRTAVKTANQTFSEINTVVEGINAGKGSLGKLIQDDKAYNGLTAAGFRVDSLATDLQQHPYRYIPFKSRAKVRRQDRLDAREKVN
jgi:phospholipid/cholesterol/gamma-HCH transport system substrate-binding protein